MPLFSTATAQPRSWYLSASCQSRHVNEHHAFPACLSCSDPNACLINVYLCAHGIYLTRDRRPPLPSVQVLSPLKFAPGFHPQADRHMPSAEHPHSQSHPERPLFLHQLAADSFERDGLPDKKEDLDKAIHLLIKDTSLPLVHPTRDEIHILLELSFALLHHLKKFGFGELDKVNSSIKYLRELHDCPLEAFDVPHHAVTASLVEMLAFRVGKEAGDVVEDINEILFFCRGLASGTPPVTPGYITSALQALTQAILDAYSRGKQIQSLDDAIGCLRQALRTCSPGLHQVPYDLANLLTVRFLAHHVDNDYEEAIVLLDRITISPSPEDAPCSCRFQAKALTTVLGFARSIANSNPEDSEEAVSRCRHFLEHSSLFGDPLHPAITVLLVSHAERGSSHIGPPLGAQAVHSQIARLLFPPHSPGGIFGDEGNGSEMVPAPLPTSLEERINCLRDHYSTACLGTDDQRNCLKDLVRCYNAMISQTRDTSLIDEAIKFNKRLLATAHPTDKSKFFDLSFFATFLYSAYNLTKRVKYLDDSITLLREVLRLDGAQQTHFVTTQRLIECLYIRWQLDGRQHESPDLDEVMSLFASGIEDTYAIVPNRLDLASHWANTAQVSGHLSLPTAYENVMSLMQSLLVFAPTLSTQYNRLSERRNLFEKTPLNFASYHINSGQLEQAVEVLEHGRALIWSEMRGLRTSTDQLRAADPALADKFTAINQELEIVTTTAFPSGMDCEDPEIEEWMGKYSGLMSRQHKLLAERNALIQQIRGLGGLENFSLPLSFDTLRSAAKHGPVIMINNCELGSDIIILHNSLPSRILTPSDFFDRSIQLKARLSKTRKDHGLNSKEHEDALYVVLKELYELVGRSVVKKLNELGIDKLSRVWWCPTSAFWDLPLHAMGPIPSDDGVIRYFSDLYISSYTPTLSALITSRRPRTQTSARPTLLVAQPSQSPPGAWWPNSLAIRGLDLQTEILSSGNMTPTTVLDSLQCHQFAHIPYDVARETAEAAKRAKWPEPFNAAMLFHNENRLTLLDIMRSRLSAGEFAFLLGSHTAEAMDGCIPDEVLHFSAVAQYIGFRSVIGTIWEMEDEDGRNLAKNVYRSMFSKKEGVEPYYERSARALQYAVQQMRPNLPLVRWVNFVHYGA